MTMLQITLSDDLARQAEAEGLLSPEAVAELLEREIGRRRHSGLFDMMRKVHQADLPPLSPDEVQAEIDAVRAERRAGGDAHRS